MKTILTSLSLVLAASPAFATGGYGCIVDDVNIKLEIGGGRSHGIPSGPFNNSGKLEFKDKALAHFDLARIDKPAQFWQEDDDLKVLVYDEPVSSTVYTSMKLIIDTKWSDAAARHVGAYRIYLHTANGTSQSLQGPIACDIE